MYPDFLHIGSLTIHTYGVFLALAFLGGILVAAKLAERDGLPRQRIYDLCLWILLASLLGSKILMFFTEAQYREHPAKLFSLDFLQSGGVFYGGLIGAVITAYVLIRRYGLPWWKTADACAPGIALGNVLGRQGCFSAGCCWGKPTTLPWGVRFTQLGHDITGVPIDAKLHPTQLYESFAMLLAFFFLLWLHRRKKFSGQVILAYVAIYAAVRFVIEFVRDDPRGDIMGLTTLTGLSTSQMIGLIVGIGALVLLIVRWRRHKAATSDALTAASPARI
ncbi:MAG: phosphatidylglycerol---prolipoprotein diacylglyceryl transferase [Blastocatellia bacterium]|jgi:phosphatidylglycerol:prolipoprotein diacylglycerol transferase|nr:phosphatidylglycerol---prolipoprotein diacylglyceryl transferase [Blastocatellia bacterium]